MFLLVATGPASLEDDLTAEEYEQVFGYLYNLSKTAPFDIKTTEAQHYSRRRTTAQGASRGISAPVWICRSRYLRVHMSQLRRKIEDQPARPRYILAEPGAEYRPSEES